MKMLLFACVGVAMEIVFTAAVDFPKTRSLRLMGYTYIWVLPLYSLIPLILFLLYPMVWTFALPLRLAIYVALLFLAEYVSGWVLRRCTGECPWERNYRGSPWTVHGLIRLDYALAWAAAAWIFEWLFVRLQGL